VTLQVENAVLISINDFAWHPHSGFPQRFKGGKTQIEQMFSGLPLKADARR